MSSSRVTNSRPGPLSDEQSQLLAEVMRQAAEELLRHGVSLELARKELDVQYRSGFRRVPTQTGFRPDPDTDVTKEWPRVVTAAGAAADALERIQGILDVNLTELGQLFGASRQAVSSWLRKGVPSARKPKVLTVLNVAELLERKLKTGRVPAVVRQPAAAYEGKSMLEMIEEDRHDQLLREVRESFDWTATS